MSALAYLRRHWKIVLLFAAFTGIFALVFSLYDLPVEAVAYAAALCLAVGAVMFLLGFLRWRARLRALEAMRRTVTVSLDGLPAPGGRAEADYQELLRILRAELARTEAAAARERREAEDYYTLWAHQIKTPIAALRLLLQSGGADSGALTAEVLRIEGYVEMALGYVRLEGGSDFVLRPCDLDEVVRGCLRKYAPLFILKKLPLDFRETGPHRALGRKVAGLRDRAAARQRPQIHARGACGRLRRGPRADRRGHGHRHRAGGPAARFRARLHRLQRPRGQKVHRPRPLPLLARLPQAGAPAHPRLRARPRHPRPPLLPHRPVSGGAGWRRGAMIAGKRPAGHMPRGSFIPAPEGPLFIRRC